MLIRDAAHLEQLQADGKIGPHDADQVRTFAAFLTDQAELGVGAAYRKHYPEDYARAVAEHQARQQQDQRETKPRCDACTPRSS